MTYDRHEADTPVKIVGAMLVHDGRVLLGKRADSRPTYPGCWDLIGGHVEPGETASAAIRREIEEELGVVPISVVLVARLNPFQSQAGLIDYHVFVVDEWDGGAPKLVGDEHTDLDWFSPTEIKSLGEMSLQHHRQLFSDALRR